MAMGISLTDRAAARINELIAADSREGHGLRVKSSAAVARACSIKLISICRKRATKCSKRTAQKCLVDMKSLLYLTGTELDYKDELMQSGFVFQNPNVKKACGCGASFTV